MRKMLFAWLLLSVMATSPTWAEETKPKEIRIGVQNVPAIGGPAKAHALSWEKKTGIKVNVVEMPFGELFSRYIKALTANDSGEFDVIFYAPAWAGDFYPYLSLVPPHFANDESFDDIHPTYRDRLMKWDKKWVAITVDGDLFLGYYRKDWFEDPSLRSEFKSQYGYDLAPPDTWKQYRDIAEFFTRKGNIDGQNVYGAAEAFARGGQQFWDAFARASAYTNHPDIPGSQFFDPETMKPAINNPGWVKAIEDYVEILRFAPPEAKKFGIVEARKAFVSGQTAMILDWGDTGPISADPKLSQIVDKIGYFVLPGSSDVWNRKTRIWDHFSRVHKAPFLAFGGWVASVPQNSSKKEAAWNYIKWYSSPENSMHDVVNGDSGVNPYRFTHFSSIDAWTKNFSRRAAAEYLGALKASLDSPHAALDLRIPGFNEYTEAFEVHLTRAINGQVNVKEALDSVAQEWEKITLKRGVEKQLKIYRASMGLANK